MLDDRCRLELFQLLLESAHLIVSVVVRIDLLALRQVLTLPHILALPHVGSCSHGSLVSPHNLTRLALSIVSDPPGSLLATLVVLSALRGTPLLVLLLPIQLVRALLMFRLLSWLLKHLDAWVLCVDGVVFVHCTALDVGVLGAPGRNDDRRADRATHLLVDI